MSDSERGIAGLNPALEDDAREALIALSNGDARAALNTLELGANGAPPGQFWKATYLPSDRGGRHPETRHSLRQVRRSALRHYLRVHKVGQVIGPRRGGLLAGPE